MRAGRLDVGGRVVGITALALVSAGWTVNVAGLGASPSSVSAQTSPFVPGGPSIPSEAIEAPASVSDLSGSAGDGSVRQVLDSSGLDAIPSAALGAYQRAETVINAADASCRLPWQLVAAIGRVESDHGRSGGSALDAGGVARPGILGPALDGRKGTAKVADTDAGQYDDDAKHDRAVGPMQFLPSTWSVVGVDADGDGERDPQDVDDAALAAAVYLCSGDEDLSSTAGRRTAVLRYNHSRSYADLVLGITDTLLASDFASVPDGTIAGGSIPDTTVTLPEALNREDFGTTAHGRTHRPSARFGRLLGSSPLGAEGAPVARGDELQGDGGGGHGSGSSDPSAPSSPSDPSGPSDDNGAVGPGTDGPDAPGDATDGQTPGQPEPTQPPTDGGNDAGSLISPEAAEACVALLGLDVDPTDAEALAVLEDDADFTACAEAYDLDPWDPADPPALTDLLGPTA